jgi:hypothetical protein
MEGIPDRFAAQGGARVPKETTPGPGVPILGPLFRGLLYGPEGRFLPFWGVLLGITVVAWIAWTKFGGTVQQSPHYQLSLESIVITPKPEWIKADVRTEALRNAAVDLPTSVLDDRLAERIAQAFAFHPWVAGVRQVRKTAEPSIEVELLYRRPVCMVELPDGLGLYAVDVDATLLPSSDFVDGPARTAGYPRLGGVTSITVGRAGTRWNDARVVGGAKIAAALEDSWKAFDLARILPTEGSPAAGGAPFELVTRGKTRIIWGSVPGNEGGGEMSAAQKIEALKHYIAVNGKLDAGGAKQLDLRGRDVSVVAAKETPEKGRK